MEIQTHFLSCNHHIADKVATDIIMCPKQQLNTFTEENPTLYKIQLIRNVSQYKILIEPWPGSISHLRKSYHESRCSLVSTRREDWPDCCFVNKSLLCCQPCRRQIALWNQHLNCSKQPARRLIRPADFVKQFQDLSGKGDSLARL